MIERDKKLTIRISKEELDHIKMEANGVGISVSDFIRMRALRMPLEFYKDFLIDDIPIPKSKKRVWKTKVK